MEQESRVLQGVPNFRDLASADTRIRPGRVLRCARPSEATEQDVQHLLEACRVRELLDLRSLEELQEDNPESLLFSKAALQQYRRLWSGQVAPIQRLESASSIVRHNVSLISRWRYYAGLTRHIPLSVTTQSLLTLPVNKERSRQMLLREVNAGGLAMMYKVILDTAQPEIFTAMELILRSLQQGRPMLLFCTAGKDRTGLISAMVLAAGGSSQEQIVEDYGRSDSYRKVAIAGIEKKPELRGLDFSRFEGAPVEAMEEALAYVTSMHGSLVGYLCAIGFGIDKQASLRQLLTSSDW